MCRSIARLACLLLPLLVFPAPAAQAGAPAHSIRTVFLIVMENKNWSDIVGNPSAPYINGVLLKVGAHATRYFNPPHVHPSLPNYLWLEAGTDFGIRDDGPPSTHQQSTSRHLVSLLTRAHISWRAYAEDISGKSCPLTSSFLYAVKHNPFVYFADVTQRGNPKSLTCIDHNRPFPTLATDLRTGKVARYNFVIPNLCDDMHDFCSPPGQVRQGDTWLAHTLPGILGSKVYRDSAVFIVWDEGEGGDGPIGMIALSPVARRGYTSSIAYSHSSMLRTLEEIFGVSPLLGDAAHANDLRALFSRFP